jgi:hypothetical protein
MSAFFKEESKLSPIFIWLTILLGIASIAGITILDTRSEAQNTSSENAIEFTYIWLFIIFISVTAFFISMKLKVEIREGKFRYYCFPFVPKWREINPESIIEWSIKKINPIFCAGGWGYRKRYFQKKTAMIMRGRIGLEMKLKNGKTLFFSIKNTESLSREMKILMKKDQY